MKKIVLTLGIILTLVLCSAPVKANGDYTSFQEIAFEEEGNRFIRDYSDEELKEYYKNVNKNKFMGWNTYEITKNTKVKYVVGTVFSEYNEGKTPMTYKMEFKEETIEKRSYSVTGSLEVNLDGKIKKMKSGLDAKLKIEYSDSSTYTKKSEWYSKTDVDPGTKLVVDLVGEGYIRNGVAYKYIFWIKVKSGAYEIFTISTQYYRLEKTPI